MSGISEYIKDISIFLIFMAFIGIILPSNKYKSYIEVVLGLILIFVVFRPIQQVMFSDGEKIQNEILAKAESIDTLENYEKYAYYENLQYEMTEVNFKSLIKSQIESILETSNFTLESFNVSYDMNLGKLNNITLKIEDKKLEKIRKGIRIEKIKVAEENNSMEENLENTEEFESEEIKILKKEISDFYNLNEDNIHITIQKKK